MRPRRPSLPHAYARKPVSDRSVGCVCLRSQAPGGQFAVSLRPLLTAFHIFLIALDGFVARRKHLVESTVKVAS